MPPDAPFDYGENREPWTESIKLVPKTIIVKAQVPTRGTLPWAEPATATYRINLEDWSCEGEVCGVCGPVFADEDWWKDHCQQVAEKVREQLREELV